MDAELKVLLFLCFVKDGVEEAASPPSRFVCSFVSPLICPLGGHGARESYAQESESAFGMGPPASFLPHPPCFFLSFVVKKIHIFVLFLLFL